jgi:hypothetical protein
VYGGSLQYSMPYLKTEVKDLGLPDLINHLIPIVEACNSSTPRLWNSRRRYAAFDRCDHQWTPLKDVCLAQCQTPLQFLFRHGGFRSDLRGCLALGLQHGGYCVGCCWVLMALLFVGGVMNVLWIALLSLLVLLEKLTPFGRWVARAAGFACIAAGAWMLLFFGQ